MRMRSGPRGLVLSPFNQDLVADAFDRMRCQPVYCYVTNSAPDRYAYAAETVQSEVEFLAALRRKILNHDINFVFATSTNDERTALCSAIYNLVRETECRYIGHPPATAERFLDKIATKEFCARREILTPRWTCDQGAVGELLESCSAVVCKKRYGMSGRDQYVAHGADDIFRSDGYFFEEMIVGIEFSANILCLPSEVIHFPLMIKGWTGSGSLHALDKPRVVAPCYSSGFFKHVAGICEELARSTDAYGWLDCEFILRERKLYLIEVNARYSGCVRSCGLATGTNPYEVHLASAFGARGHALAVANRIVVELPIKQHVTCEPKGVFLQLSENRSLNIGRAIFNGESLDDVRSSIVDLDCVDVAQFEELRGVMSLFRQLADDV